VLVKEASQKEIAVPPVYETVTEKVMVEPAKTVWKKGRGLVEKIDHTTGEIMCLVEIVKVADAQFIWHEIHNREMSAKTRTGNQICLKKTPARYKTVTRRVVKTPASTKTVEIPAQYKISGKIQDHHQAYQGGRAAARMAAGAVSDQHDP